jgi:type I restriction enzyme M protein
VPRKISDFVSGALVNDGPEERITQVLTRHLVDDLGYSKAQIRTRPQWRVPRSPGTARSRGFPVDVIVFRDEAGYDDSSAAYMIFECKAASHRLTERDEEELKLYLQNEPAARLGVLFNGFGGEDDEGQVPRVFFKWIKPDGSIEFRELAGFPRAGEPPDLGEPGRLRRELEKAPNLRAIFRDVRNYIHSFDRRSRRDEEIIREIVRLLICKIYDEDRGPNDVVQFRWLYEDTDEDLGNRIRAVYGGVRDAYPEIFEDDETDIRLDDQSIRYVVTRLQKYEITNSERHAIGDAFEVFIGDALKGKEGQYFTPRNVTEMMVEFLDPSPTERFIDPACGTGGFLVSTMGHVYRQIEDLLRDEGREHLTEKRQHDWARRFLRGIDLDSLCIKFSKAYTALLGDGHTGLYHADSLEQGRWPADMKRGIKPGTFRVVMTNPPFGQGLVKTGEVLREYDLARKWRRRKDGTWEMTDQIQKKQEIGILFLEYCLKLLEPGGRMGIVLLESYLGNQSDGYIPAWLLEHFTVLGVVDLPDTTFQPHTHAKTCVLFIENSPPPKAYNILMAAAERVGHDNRGNTIYEEDADFRTRYVDGKPVVDDDLPKITEQLRALRDGRDVEENEYGFTLSNEEVQDQILIPRYYDRSYVERLTGWAEAHDCALVSPRTLIDQGVIAVYRGHGGMKSQWYLTEPGGVPYIRTSNIGGLEIEYQSRHVVRVPEEIYERVTARKEPVKAGDLLLVRRGEDRIGDVAIVYEGFDRLLTASEIDIIRVVDAENDYGITPNVLLYLMSHPLVREQFRHKMFYETIIWNVADRWRDILLRVAPP